MIQSVQLNAQLHANQLVIHHNPARMKAIKAGKRFGKTKWATFEIVHQAGKRPGLYWYVGPTYGQAKDIAWRELKNIIPAYAVKKKWESELTIELVGGSVIVLKGADNQDALRGPEINGYVLDEYAYFDDYVWDGILSGQLSEDGFAYFISSPNKNGRNHFTNFCEEMQRRQAAGESCAYFYYTIYDNPTKSREWIEKLRDGMPEDRWNLEYMAIDSAKSGLIFSEFNYDRHCKPVPEKLANPLTYRAIDWGMDHPTVCLSAKIVDGKAPVYVDKLFKRSDLVIEESAAIINQIWAGDNIVATVADPSLKKRNSHTKVTDFQEFERCGIGAIPADNNERGYDIVKMFLKKNLLVIDPSLKDLIYELRHIQYGDKEGDDVTDCLRYLLVYIHDTVFDGSLFEQEADDIYEKIQKESQGRTISLFDKRLFPNRNTQNQDLSWVFDEAI